MQRNIHRKEGQYNYPYRKKNLRKAKIMYELISKSRITELVWRQNSWKKYLNLIAVQMEPESIKLRAPV